MSSTLNPHQLGSKPHQAIFFYHFVTWHGKRFIKRLNTEKNNKPSLIAQWKVQNFWVKIGSKTFGLKQVPRLKLSFRKFFIFPYASIFSIRDMMIFSLLFVTNLLKRHSVLGRIMTKLIKRHSFWAWYPYLQIDDVLRNRHEQSVTD